MIAYCEKKWKSPNGKRANLPAEKNHMNIGNKEKTEGGGGRKKRLKGEIRERDVPVH